LCDGTLRRQRFKRKLLAGDRHPECIDLFCFSVDLARSLPPGDRAGVAIDKLLPLLEDQHPSVRSAAASALAQIPAGDRAINIIDKLLSLLDDQYSSVQDSAASALAQIPVGDNTSSVIDKLLPLLGSDKPLKQETAPDTIDRESGTFIYFGDNKRPGRGLHETLRFGNVLLRRFFEHAHSESTDRNTIPPIFVFAKTGEWRDVRFIGLAVPGGADIENYDDLVAIWRTSKGLRFQNYRARFTILDVPLVSRAWLDSLAAGTKSHDLAPPPWMEWREKGRYRPPKSVRSIEHRSKGEQLPVTVEDRAMILDNSRVFRGPTSRFRAVCCGAGKNDAIAGISIPSGKGLR
jgi:hypothetical protein